MHLEKHRPTGGHIRQLDNVSGRALERGKRCGGRARTTCRSQGIRKGEHFSRRASIKGPKIRCSAVPVHPKAAVAGCLAMPSSAYNGTPAQPQSQAMGAARRDPRRGEIPGAQCQLRSSPAAQAWGSCVEYRQKDDFTGKSRFQKWRGRSRGRTSAFCVSGSRLSEIRRNGNG